LAASDDLTRIGLPALLGRRVEALAGADLRAGVSLPSLPETDRLGRVTLGRADFDLLLLDRRAGGLAGFDVLLLDRRAGGLAGFGVLLLGRRAGLLAGLGVLLLFLSGLPDPVDRELGRLGREVLPPLELPGRLLVRLEPCFFAITHSPPTKLSVISVTGCCGFNLGRGP